MTSAGAGVFFDRKWYYSLGSILFVLGIAGMYIGYTSKDADTKYMLILTGFITMIVASMLFTFDPTKKISLFTNYTKSINY